MTRSPPPFADYDAPPMSTRTLPIGSTLDPPPGSNGLGRWVSAHLAAMSAHLDHLREHHAETRREMIEWQRAQDSTAAGQALAIATTQSRVAAMEDRQSRIEATRIAQPVPAPPEKPVSLKDRIEHVKAIGAGLLWLAAAALGVINALDLLEPETIARLKNALAALSSAPTGH